MRSLLASVASIALAASAVPAHATFIQDASCGQSQCTAETETKMFIDVANKKATNFGGTVGSSAIDMTTTGEVDTGSGFATIKPIKGGTLTDLIFTPTDDTLFGDFSFRGQLDPSGFNGDIDVTWTDSSGVTGTVSFTGIKGPNADFARLGIISDPDGDTLKSVEVKTTGDGSFKEFKQVEFSFSDATPAPVPEPAALIPLSAGLLGLGMVRWSRRRS